MFQRLKIVVMLGGPSAEREVSLRSGAGVVKALRSLGHTVVELDPKTPDWILPPDTEVVCLAPLHGTYGEDGTVQRQLAQLDVLYTGCDSEASRIAFDKVLTKQKCIAAGVPTAKFAVVNSEKAPLPKDLRLPLVVKPVRQGSSVGLQFVERAEDWQNALVEALKFDSEILVEEKIVGRETTVFRKLQSRIANSIRRALLKDETRDAGCAIRAFRRELFLSLPYFDGLDCFLLSLVRREGLDIGFVDVVERPRRCGASNYGMWNRLWVGILDTAGVWWLIRRRKHVPRPQEVTLPVSCVGPQHCSREAGVPELRF